MPSPGETFKMLVNRPFLYAIQDDRSGAILFLGQLVDPAPLATMTWEQEQKAAFPDALEVMESCMSDGLSFTVAMGRVYERFDNEVAKAMGRVLQEIQLKKPLPDALRDMSVRLSDPDVKVFVEAVNHSDMTQNSLLAIVQKNATWLRSKYPRR
jgi:Flp pilus assembly protein TadB